MPSPTNSLAGEGEWAGLGVPPIRARTQEQEPMPEERGLPGEMEGSSLESLQAEPGDGSRQGTMGGPGSTLAG